MQFSSNGVSLLTESQVQFHFAGRRSVPPQIPTTVEFHTDVETLVTLHPHQCRLQNSWFFSQDQ